MASNIIIKTPEQIEKLRVAGRIAAEVLEMIEPYVQAGITTEELDDIMLKFIEDDRQAISACLGYHGYPKCTCISINEVVCHGIPGKHKLHNGDIVNIDVTVIKDGFHGDTSKMFVVGQTSPRNHKLVKVTQQCLYEAIRAVGPGKNLTEVGRVIENIAKKEGFSIVRDYCGHGIGEGFHEEPQVVHYYPNPYSLILKPGMVFTIEPMLNAGTWKVKVNRKDGWTVTTSDKQPSAQFEHTIVITETGCEVLTLRKEEEETLGRYITNAD
ncbi:MAG: type I methionyl aminopeptidase [Ruminobacter sp.]|uniref:type I methionyl aminopeptidase n=1 Tax=Ruminobacter sp. TaxID=2774296 RepID=UPI00257FC890|nr:type I methionyl aminopeptidase [Ruminobacter sp.]MBQ3774779.1 type I methionyl aminopeptidase [Ruminobacter sp.]